jgi:TetR/AcrR family transcriptional regulator
MPLPDRSPEEPARRERNAQATRQRILDAAEREFAARGFAGARLRQIGDTASVQSALIHHYFADKRGLYRAVLDRALLSTSTDSVTLLGSRSDLPGLIEGFVDLLVRFQLEHEHVLAILRHESMSGGDVFAEVCRERARPILEALSASLEDRRRAGEVRDDVPVAQLLLALMGMIFHPFSEATLVEAMMPGAIPRGPAAIDRHKRALVALIHGALRPPSPPPPASLSTP